VRVKKDTIVALGIHQPRDASAVAGWLGKLPFTLASFATIHPSWLEPPLRYLAPGFGDGHASLGWACAFRGAGHERLVSPRWLPFAGPWLLHTVGDTSLVQFHDLDADAATALVQARPGHRRMGISDEGGFLQQPYLFAYEIRGRWNPADHMLTVIVHGRDVPPREMLDYGAARKTQALGPEQPLDRIRFLFMEETRALAHLHELWLHGLECWTIAKGLEKRLDDGYQPPSPRPAWADRRDATR
jgi:hypothetical protein